MYWPTLTTNASPDSKPETSKCIEPHDNSAGPITYNGQHPRAPTCPLIRSRKVLLGGIIHQISHRRILEANHVSSRQPAKVIHKMNTTLGTRGQCGGIVRQQLLPTLVTIFKRVHYRGMLLTSTSVCDRFVHYSRRTLLPK